MPVKMLFSTTLLAPPLIPYRSPLNVLLVMWTRSASGAPLKSSLVCWLGRQPIAAAPLWSKTLRSMRITRLEASSESMSWIASESLRTNRLPMMSTSSVGPV